METTCNVQIPVPCHENWNRMTPTSNGRHCSVCQKSVVDFTKKSTNEIRQYFQQAQGSTCGRFNATQVFVKRNKFHQILLERYQKVEHSASSQFGKLVSLSMLSLCMLVVSCDWKFSSDKQLTGDTVYVEKVDSSQLKKINQVNDTTRTNDSLQSE